MKKNLMNAALLGLLIATPACSFVSCKDYDEDFKKVNSRLDDLVAAKAQIEKEIQSNKTALETTNKKTAEIEGKFSGYATKEELSAAKANLEKLVADASATAAKLSQLEAAKKLIETNSDDIKAIKSKLEAVNSKAATFLTTADLDKVAALPAKVETQEKAIAEFEKRVADLEAKGTPSGNAAGNAAIADEFKAELKKLKEANYQSDKQVEAAIKAALEKFEKDKLPQALNMLQTADVTSLQLRPLFYSGGIEGIANMVFGHNLFDVVDDADANGIVTFTKDAEITGEDEVSYAEAEYNVNPTDAKVVLDKANFHFDNLRPETRSEQDGEGTVEVVGTPTFKNGVLTVGFRSTLPADENDEINTVALFYTAPAEGGKTARVVSSDYARLLDVNYENLQIGKTSEVEEPNLGVLLALPVLKDANPTETARIKDDRDNRLTFEISNKGTDFPLAKHITTYGDGNLDENNYKWFQIDENADADGFLKGAGFHYEYALVKDGAKDKSVDAFDINKETGVVKAKFDENHPYQHVGKVAVVRVTLVSDQGRVASVGYFQVKVALQPEVLTTLSSNEKISFVCDADEVLPAIRFSNKEMVEKLGNDWQKNWEVLSDVYTMNEGVAQKVAQPQFKVSSDSEGILVADLSRKKAGVNKLGDSFVTYVKVQNKANPNTFFLVKLAWMPAEVQAAPSVTFTGVPKDKAFTTGSFHIHADIVSDITNGQHQKFEQDVNDLFAGALVSTIAKSEYPRVGVYHKWVFVEPRVKTAVGSDGKTYKLGVDVTNKYFTATNAGVTTNVASITKEGVLKYEDNAVAKALLSQYSAKQLEDGQTLTARIAYKTYFSGCYTEVPTKGVNEFDVKFIRPLNVVQKNIKTFTDAYKLEQNSGDLDLHRVGFLTDWRDYNVGGQDKQEQFFDTYSAKVYLEPKDKWLTDFGTKDDFKTFKELNVKNNFDLEFVSVTGNGHILAPTPQADGRLLMIIDKNHWVANMKYTTKTANVADFKVLIPYTIEYKWGVLHGNFEVVVKGTINQPKPQQ